MSAQRQLHRPVREGESDSSQDGNVHPAKTDSPSETKALSDELLDEIDALLETNAAEFVAQYVQQGGQ